jgi:hypothetical protein
VHALRRIHAALVPSGTLIDTQPVSARPPVFSNGARLGTLDMRQWIDTVEAVDRLVAETIAAGLYTLEREQRFPVTDTYDNGPQLVETVSDWQGTRISRGLTARVTAAKPPLALTQEIRLRLLRRRA